MDDHLPSPTSRRVVIGLGDAADSAEAELPTESMPLNMGPSHPAMHGTVRMVLEVEGEKREFKVTMDDVAHWAGMSPTDAQTLIGHFANQRRLELFADKIVVKNISDFIRFVNSRRKK